MNDRGEREVRLACFVLPVRDGRVLLARHTYAYTDVWAMVGGMAEGTEAPDVAAVREVREETGLVVTADRLVALVDRGDVLIVVYAGEVVAGTERAQEAEIAELRWFDADELAAANAFDLVKTIALPLLGSSDGLVATVVRWPDGMTKAGHALRRNP